MYGKAALDEGSGRLAVFQFDTAIHYNSIALQDYRESDIEDDTDGIRQRRNGLCGE